MPAISLEQRNILCLISARSISDLGAFLNLVAFSSYTYFLSNQAIMVGLMLAARVAGGVLASLLGTSIFRRFHGRTPLIVMDVLRSVAVVTLLLTPTSWHLTLLPIISLTLGFGNSIFSIGLNSQIPSLVSAARHMSVNTWLTAVSSFGRIIGSLAGGLILTVAGYDWVFQLNAFTYLLAGILILPLHFTNTSAKLMAIPKFKQEFQQLLSGLKAFPILATMLIITLFDTLGSAAHNVGFPVLSQHIASDRPGAIMGYLLAAWALGKLIGAYLAHKFSQNSADLSKILEKFFFLGVSLMSIAFIITFQQQQIQVALAIIFLAGLGDGIAEVTLITRIQKTPETLRLPAFSLMTFLQMTGFGIGMLLCSPFFEYMSAGQVILIFHGLPLGAILVSLFYLLKREYWSAEGNHPNS